MGALVRQHDLVRVGLDLDRGQEALAPASDSVRPYERLLQPPERRLGVAVEHSLLAPGGEQRARIVLVLGQREIDDVVRRAGQISGARLGVDHVVGGRDKPLQRPGNLGVEGQRFEGLYVSHREERTNSLVTRLD